jgi:hypothetical protein
MTSLDDAWDWYTSTRDGCRVVGALASYWSDLPWGAMRPPPDRLKQVEADDLRALKATIETRLDDVAVLVLFSVFEATVRELLVVQLDPEIARISHPMLKSAADNARSDVRRGPFYPIIEGYRAEMPDDVVEGVNQVRKYRNWVAHGRPLLEPGEQLASVDPESAYRRLSRFLTHLRGEHDDPATEPAS